MHLPRGRTCFLLVAVLALALAISGCGGDEQESYSTLAKAPLVGGFVQQLKQEDDESEEQQLREEQAQLSPAERREQREEDEEAEQHKREEAEGAGPSTEGASSGAEE